MRFLFFLPCLFLALGAFAADSVDLAPIKKWIARQDEVHTVQADFVQTRALRALRSPIATHGRLWFSAPNLLRWELGDPVRTIVLRRDGASYLIQPGKKKAERLGSLGSGKDGENGALAMMNFPIARDFGDYNRRFETLSTSTTDGHCHLEILPRDPQARKFLAAMKIDFDVSTGYLISFEMVTRDGSSMRNDFSRVRMNEKIDHHVFDYDLAGYEVVDGKN